MTLLVRGAKWLVVDSAERNPIQWNELCLRLCGGVEAKGLKGGELLEVLEQKGGREQEQK